MTCTGSSPQAWWLLVALCVIACGAPPEVEAPPVDAIDRTEAPAPEGLRMELRMDGGDATLRAFAERLPPSPWRAAFPTDLESFVDALVALPAGLSGHLAPSSELRAVMADVGGQTRSAILLRLRDRPTVELRPGGPRGALLLDETTAIVDDLVVIADDARMLELALPYLAFGARPPVEGGTLVVRATADTLRGTIRPAIEHVLDASASDLTESARAARHAHAAPPTLGDPEALVALLRDTLAERIAYLPDLGDATLTLAPGASGIVLSLTAPITPDSPLAEALGERVPVDRSLVVADEGAAVVVATGATDAAQDRDAALVVDAIARVAGDRMESAERTTLMAAATALAHARGPSTAFVLGAGSSGGYLSLLTTDAPSDAAIPTPWGRVAPFFDGAIGTLAGCDPVEPRGADPTICGARALATRRDGARFVATAGADAGSLADATLARLATAAVTSSPDLARDLEAIPSSPFAVVLVRPLRALPVLAAMRGAAPSSPRGDGALVLAVASDAGTLRIVLAASTSGLADLATVAQLFEAE